VLSEEQIRLKKMKKQEEETARTSTVATPSPAPEMPPLAPEQQEMIEKLVSMQKQCNKRSFLDRPKVTVRVFLCFYESLKSYQSGFCEVGLTDLDKIIQLKLCFVTCLSNYFS